MVKINISREGLEKTSIEFMENKGYYLQSITENQIIFTGGKDVNTIILILSFLIFLVVGILYYALSKTHKITINVTQVADSLQINATGSTKESISISEDFVNYLIIRAPVLGYEIQELKCPKCGSSLDFVGKDRFIKCEFCAANLAVNELR